MWSLSKPPPPPNTHIYIADLFCFVNNTEIEDKIK